MQGLRYIAVGFMLAVIVLVAGGCGGSDSTSAGNSGSASDVSSQVTSKAVFIKEANAICTKMVERIRRGGFKAFREYGQAGEGAKFRSALTAVLIPSIEGEIEGIQSLTPPAGDKAHIDAIVAALHQIVHDIKFNPSAHEYYPYKKAERLTNAYGLTACGRPALQ